MKSYPIRKLIMIPALALLTVNSTLELRAQSTSAPYSVKAEDAAKTVIKLRVTTIEGIEYELTNPSIDYTMTPPYDNRDIETEGLRVIRRGDMALLIVLWKEVTEIRISRPNRNGPPGNRGDPYHPVEFVRLDGKPESDTFYLHLDRVLRGSLPTSPFGTLIRLEGITKIRVVH